MATRSTRKSTPVPTPSTSTSQAAKASPMSPTRISRLTEKLELQNLNDRLAVYIDRVRTLEAENSVLSKQMTTVQESVTREITTVKSMYEQELSDARKLLDDTAKEKARLQIESNKWKTELDEVQQKLKKKEKDFTTAEKKLIQFESQNQDLQARLNQLTSERKRLEDALKEAESERDRLSKQLETAKKQLDEEAVYRVDLLNRIQSTKEELAFKETVHEREMSESRVMKQTDISDFDINLKEHFEQKLADTLREIRDQYETQMKINRDEIETMYEIKLADLQSLCDQYSSSSHSTRDELGLLKSKCETLTSKMSELESQNEALKRRIKDLEGIIEQERKWHQLALQSKDDEIKNLRSENAAQIKEYEDLLDIKIALDMEIAAYRKLLEVEESRLNITPSRTAAAEVARSTPVRRTPLRGKRKRAFLETGELSDSQSSASAKGDVEISDHDPEGKFVKLHNKGSSDIPLGAWQLVRRAGEQETMFKFHRTVVIKANSNVTVWSSDSGIAHNPPTEILMKGQKWFTAETMSTTLLNNNGEEMAVRETSKRIRSSERLYSAHTAEELYHQQGDPENPQERCAIM